MPPHAAPPHAAWQGDHFLRFSGEWKLVDLGSVVDENTECVPSYTERYASPEVAAAVVGNAPLRVTAAVDVWSLGVILYELYRTPGLEPSSSSSGAPIGGVVALWI